MVNLNVGYRAPVPAATTLWSEVQTRWPDCAQNKGFVAGSGPTTWNISSHNADAQGFAHALDIGVDIEFDGTGIPIQDGIDLAEHLRAIGYKEWASGRAGRLAYIIHREQIAGDQTGWAWVPYYGISPHYDHIHVSFSFDFYWGDPVWESTSEVHSTAPWGVADGITNQSGNITPITEDEFDMASVEDVINGLMDLEVPKSDGSGDITLRRFLAYSDGNFNAIKVKVADINTASGPKSIRQFIADGTRAAQAGAAQTADINTAQGPKSLRQFIADGTRASQGSAPVIVTIADAVVAPNVDLKKK